MQWNQNIAASILAWRGKFATGGVSVLALMLAYHVVFGQNGWVAYHEKKLEYQRLQVEVQQIQAENDRYTKQIKSLKTDPKAIEKEAREQLHYANPNEVIVVMPAPKPQQQNTATAQAR
jgi:cell division protein FtsB